MTSWISPPMSTGAGALGEGGAVGAVGAVGEVGEDGEASFAAEAGAEEPSPFVVVAGADATVVAGAAGVPVGLSDALPGPPPSATVDGVPGGAFGLEPPATASEPMPPGPIDNEGAAGEPLPKPWPPKFGAAFVLAAVAVELPVPFVVFVGPNSSPVSAEMLLRAACA